MSRAVAVSLAALAVGLALGLWPIAPPSAFAQPPDQSTPAPPTAPGAGGGASATPAPESEPPPGSGAGAGVFVFEPTQWMSRAFDLILVELLRGLSDALRRVVGGVLGSSLNFITQTPPAGSYASPTVLALWGVVRTIANSALAAVFLWAGLNLIVREQIGSPYYEAMELLPRLVLGALLANTSLSWGRLAIDANNALCHAVGQSGLPAWERAGTAVQLFADVVAIVIYLSASLLLLLQMLMRLALIDVLVIISPLALLCWVLPQTQGWARLWSGLFFGAVFTQFVQVVTLKLGAGLLTELTLMAPDAAMLSLFLGVAVLVLTLKIPGLMRQHAGDGLGLARVYVYQRLSAALAGSSGRGGAGRPAPGAPRAGA